MAVVSNNVAVAKVLIEKYEVSADIIDNVSKIKMVLTDIYQMLYTREIVSQFIYSHLLCIILIHNRIMQTTILIALRTKIAYKVKTTNWAPNMV